MYKRIAKLTKKQYKQWKKENKIQEKDDVYKTYDYKGHIIYTIYRFITLP